MGGDCLNTYTFDSISVGQKASFSTVISSEKMEMFRSISGDCNPLHCDSGYAQEAGHPGVVVYGMLTASFLSTLAGVYLPGKYSLIHSVEVKCAAPVYVNDTLCVSGEVVEKNDTFRYIIVKCRITNQNNQCVMRGKMQIGVRN